MNNFYWQLNDGRIWSSQDAGWINKDELPQRSYLTVLYDDGKPAELSYLIKTINFYGFELGSLAASEDKPSSL